MRYFLVLISLMCHTACFAQKDELKKRIESLKYDEANSKSLHVQYQLTIQSREGNTTESVVMDFKKTGDKCKMEMGEGQLTMVDKDKFVVVNHTNKIIQTGEDTSGTLKRMQMMEQLGVLVDSMKSIVMKEKDGVLTYTMTYQNFDYSKVEIAFDKKSGKIKSLYGEFAPNYRDPFKYMKAEYRVWDNRWPVPSGFPGMNEYIFGIDGRSQLTASNKGYKLIHTGRRPLSVNR